MKTFIVTVERTVVYTEKYEVQAQDKDEAINMFQFDEAAYDPFYQEDELVEYDCSAVPV
jgi:hypothetical protein